MNRLPAHIAGFQRHRGHRKGSILVLMTALLPVLFILAALTINIAYMQLTRTEMMVATDAAARSGGRALSEFQDVDAAITMAAATAAMNNVAGQPLRLKTDDNDDQVEFGDATADSEYSRYVFDKKNTQSLRSGGETANAIRISSYRNTSSETGQVELPFPGFGMAEEWDVQMQAVAMQVDRDISLILDRSGSMDWVTYDWPSGQPWNYTTFDAAVDAGVLYQNWQGNYYYSSGQNSTTYQEWVWEEYLGNAPLQTPWEGLKAAVAAFLDVLETTQQNELVSVATYSSSATLDVNLEDDYDLINSTVATKYPSGSTAIGSGMLTGSAALTGASARPMAAKTMIVMTDGMHNYGTDPATAATQMVASYNVTIHTVTFGGGADQSTMQEVAAIGGGNHYHADDTSELVEVFEEIANNLPTIVTQ
ncbi:MAG: VWA domain-containing protein [Planctomycetota bacterium]